MKSHLSAVHTGLETPYTPASPLLGPHPVYFTSNVNGSFLEEKKMGEKRGSNWMHVLLGSAEQSEQQSEQATSHS